MNYYYYWIAGALVLIVIIVVVVVLFTSRPPIAPTPNPIIPINPPIIINPPDITEFVNTIPNDNQTTSIVQAGETGIVTFPAATGVNADWYNATTGALTVPRQGVYMLHAEFSVAPTVATGNQARAVTLDIIVGGFGGQTLQVITVPALLESISLTSSRLRFNTSQILRLAAGNTITLRIRNQESFPVNVIYAGATIFLIQLR